MSDYLFFTPSVKIFVPSLYSFALKKINILEVFINVIFLLPFCYVSYVVTCFKKLDSAVIFSTFSVHMNQEWQTTVTQTRLEQLLSGNILFFPDHRTTNVSFQSFKKYLLSPNLGWDFFNIIWNFKKYHLIGKHQHWSLTSNHGFPHEKYQKSCTNIWCKTFDLKNRASGVFYNLLSLFIFTAAGRASLQVAKVSRGGVNTHSLLR